MSHPCCLTCLRVCLLYRSAMTSGPEASSGFLSSRMRMNLGNLHVKVIRSSSCREAPYPPACLGSTDFVLTLHICLGKV